MNLLNVFSRVPEAPSFGDRPLICFSHLRWDFVLQRPQHLMRRFSAERQVLFFEEFIPTDHHLAYLEIHPFEGTRVKSIRPRIPHCWTEEDREAALRSLLDDVIQLMGIRQPVLWFYTPMMFSFARHVDASAVIYDCMDELANFKFAPPRIKELESALIARADAVFTGGYSLYEAKKRYHDNIHPFPSSVDAPHFRAARSGLSEPADQATIPGPKLGFCGVIDERLDLDLIRSVAALKPNLAFVFLGPVIKISPDELPRANNIHYLGQKAYSDLPAYLSSWDAALMPFALNEATQYISPTKTPEYLAAGRPVISTRIFDVDRSYGSVPGVFIADDAKGFVEACEAALEMKSSSSAWLKDVDALLALSSWDDTFHSMKLLVEEALDRKNRAAAPPRKFRVKKGGSAYDYVIVGAGFAGSVLTERLAADAGKRVLICDRRSHVGGNAHDYYNDDGILVHRYGPHIFHTNSEEIFDYLSRFTAWRPYEHRVLAQVGDQRLPIPINRTTLNRLYGLDLSDDAAAERFLGDRAEPCHPIRTSRDVVVSQVGTELYRVFFEGYTRKQWGLDPEDLDKSVTARVPTRTNIDDRYFLDRFQVMPLHGYTPMFERMLDHDNITVMLGTDYADIRGQGLAPHTIFTGPIDEYYNYRFGQLPYRSLEFVHETHDVRRFLPVGVVNYPSEDVPYTRVTEYKHLTGQVHAKTSISYEFSRPDGDPYYPIPRPENQILYKQYEALARQLDQVTFVGRLGTYKYYNMDQVIGQALATYKRLRLRHGVTDPIIGGVYG